MDEADQPESCLHYFPTLEFKRTQPSHLTTDYTYERNDFCQ